MKLDPRRIVSVESPGMRRVRAVLEAAAGPLDATSISEAAHVSVNTFSNSYRHLLIRAGLIHIAGYLHGRQGRQRPTYLSGPQIGEPPIPPKLDHKVSVRAWKERTGYYEAEKARRRLARPPDFALAALMGITPRYRRYPKNTTHGAERAGKDI